MILVAIAFLILILDIFAIRDIYKSNMDKSLQFLYTVIVLFVPIIGYSIYYMTKAIR